MLYSKNYIVNVFSQYIRRYHFSLVILPVPLKLYFGQFQNPDFSIPVIVDIAFIVVLPSGLGIEPRGHYYAILCAAFAFLFYNIYPSLHFHSE